MSSRTLLERASELRNTALGKFIATMMAIVMVISLSSVLAFAADEGGAHTAQSAPVAAQSKSVSANEAAITLHLDHAYAVVAGQNVTSGSVKVPLQQDFTFSVAADTGYEITGIEAHNGQKGGDVDVIDNGDGTYTVAANYVTSALKVTVSTKQVADATSAAPALLGSSAGPSTASAGAAPAAVQNIPNISLKLTAPSPTFVYRGAAYDINQVNNLDNLDNLPAGYTAQATLLGSQTDVGTSQLDIVDVHVFDENGVDITSRVSIELVPGTIEVTPAPLTVETASATKAYDGKPLTATDDARVEGLQGGETAKVVATGSQTEVGFSDNTYEIEWGTADANNYYVENTILGSLEVTESAQTITVTTTGGIFTYDGKAHGATVEVTGLPEGYRVVEATSSASLTNAGRVTATCDNLIIENAAGEDVTNSLNVEYIDGNLVVNPMHIIVTSGSAIKAFDGQPLTHSEVTVTGLPEGFTFNVDESTAITDEGYVPNEFSMTINTNGAGEGAGVEITDVIDDAAEMQKLFDSTRLDGKTSVSTAASFWFNGVTEADLDNYFMDIHFGRLTIAPQGGVVITTDSQTKTYDGKPLQATEATFAGLPEGYTVEATVSGSQTDVGESEAAIESYVIRDADGKDVTAELADMTTVRPGMLTVTPAKLTIDTASASKVFDGTALTATDNATISGFVNGETAQFAVTGSQTEVGTSQNVYTIDWNGTAKQSNYTIEEHLGALTVGAAPTNGGDTNNGGNSGDSNSGTAGAGSQGGVVAGNTVNFNNPTNSGSYTPIFGTTTTTTYSTPSGTATRSTYTDNSLFGNSGRSSSAPSSNSGSSQSGTASPAPSIAPSATSSSAPTASATPGPSASGTPTESGASGGGSTGGNVLPASPSPKPEEEIGDNDTPLGAFDEPNTSWLTFYTLLGILLTVAYGIISILRRLFCLQGLKKDENKMLGKNVNAKEGSQIGSVSHAER